MNFAIGFILIAVTVAMVMVARPADGESAPFLKVWFVGQAYALAAMVTAWWASPRRLSTGHSERLFFAGGRPRFVFVDHRFAGQALKRVEIGEILARAACLHGDAANGARTQLARAGLRSNFHSGSGG